MTDLDQIPAAVKAVFLETFKVEQQMYSEDCGPSDIPQWDSLGNVRLIQAIEAHFGVSFDIMDLFEVETVSDLIALVERYAKRDA